MGGGAPTNQGAVAGDHGDPVGVDPPAPDRASPARRQGLGLGGALARTVAHFFPKLSEWLGEVRDARDQGQIIYSRRFLIWMGLMAFLLKLGSRRQVRFELDSPEALANLNQLSRADQQSMAHSDTLNYFLGKVPPASLARVRRQMVQRLVRMKALDGGRLFKHFLVVIDATGQLHFGRRHCPHCLEQKHGEKTLYFHNVLEAKLVTPDGLVISLDSEFIENTDPKASKQDCELKAFVRLAGRLKRDYPQMPLCLGMDGLYANGTVMEICRENHWKYLITFKEGSLPALWTEYQALLKLCPKNQKAHRTPEEATQTFAWVERLEHIDDQKRRHKVNVFQCQEEAGGQNTLFVWLTNWSINAGNVATLANCGGRCRWKIENEGFNIQKNGGFNLEHAYSTGERQIKNFYILLQIAHLILQLVERGSLLGEEAKKLFGSLRNLARRLAESIRNALIPSDAIDPILAASIQIRLNTS
jgi:hypothetical protein